MLKQMHRISNTHTSTSMRTSANTCMHTQSDANTHIQAHRQNRLTGKRTYMYTEHSYLVGVHVKYARVYINRLSHSHTHVHTHLHKHICMPADKARKYLLGQIQINVRTRTNVNTSARRLIM